MELVRISANNLKVTLTEKELEDYGITVPEGDGEHYCGARHAVKKILEAVKKETGVDYCGERVFVRIYKGSDGGCELFISRTSRPEEKVRGCAVFRFDSVSSLIDACRSLPPYCASDAYTEGEAVFLLLPLADDASLAAARERGSKVDFLLAEEYVREHCRLICEKNAIKRLGML